MFFPLGALGSFGTGAMEGVGTGMDLADKYQTLKGQANFIQSMGGVEGLSQMMQEALTPSPEEQPAAASAAQPPSGVMAGAQPTMQAGLQPGPALQFPQVQEGPRFPMPPQAPQGAMAQAGAPAQMRAMTMSPQPMMPGAASQPAAQPPPAAGGGGMFGGSQIFAPGERPIAMGAAPAQGAPQPQAPRPQAPQPPPIQPTAERGTAPKMTSEQALRFMQTGVGPFSLPNMAKRIQSSMPNASPLEKFYALKAGMKLMNGTGQQQFSQTMQWLQYLQREQQHADTLKHQRTMEELAIGRQDPEKQAALAAAKKGATALIQGRQREIATLNTQLGSIESQSQNMLGNMDRLAAIAKEVQITGSMPIDTWINNIKAKFGNTNALMYQAQLNTTRQDVSRVLNNPTGNAALTDSARTEAQEFLHGVLRPKTIEAFKELYRVDAKIKRESITNQIKAAEKDIEEYGGHRVTEPAETTAGQAAPANIVYDDKGNAKKWNPATNAWEDYKP